ncbi:hypothetical protein ACLVWU_13595 [Bdellovibrio sp. HCB290]|uniref:hypothetical protein n=1 Tax=Bdellovibrio sp. HCB290 TaxID=3394356 RepID=UPI0039B5E68D
MKNVFSVILPLFLMTTYASAQQPVVGRDAAAKYFQKDTQDDTTYVEGGGSTNNGPSDHYLALHYGRYMASQSYDWGKNGQEDDVGKNSFGVTYRVGEWYNSMDLALRMEYNDYEVGGENPSKISFLPVIMFPDASSRFPLYFGAGAGLGIFMKQTNSKSMLTLDYQLLAGARFFNVFESTGFFIEAGLRNSLFLLSSGQLNGTFLAAGLVFTF